MSQQAVEEKKEIQASNCNTETRLANKTFKALSFLKQSGGIVVKECRSRCGNDVLIGRPLLHVNGISLFQNQKAVESGCGLWSSRSAAELRQAEGAASVAL